jgi:hypothetical protein
MRWIESKKGPLSVSQKKRGPKPEARRMPKENFNYIGRCKNEP